MIIGQFFNYKENKINNYIKFIINEIMKAYTSMSDKTYKIDEEDIIISKIGYIKVI